ncbi:uncharacterized protein LOC131161306 [Malania oleifera]|uniref:uncharacterized protein LOC131161306 n=1 Tax=Malania oleifera TaxID=397392 RepID=UPI0025ADEC2B|nr:uncharacterized protein LOC131161306 [Malania oleifera]
MASGGEAGGEFQDWEVLHDSDSPVVSSSDWDNEPSRAVEVEVEGIEGDSEGVIRPNYFSLDLEKRYVRTTADVSEEGSVESDKPSWIDPGSETRYERKNLAGSWSDSSSDRSESRKLSDFDARQELGFVENAKSHVGFEGIDEIRTENRVSGKFWSDLSGDPSDFRKLMDFDGKGELSYAENLKNQVGFEGIDEVETRDKDCNKVWLDSGGYGSLSVEFRDARKSEIGLGGYAETGSENLSENNGGSGLVEELEGGNECAEGDRSMMLEGSEDETVAVTNSMKSNGGKEKKKIVWWKLPLEFVRFCIFRVSPIWSFSLAAAVMGFIILGRQLYKMKRKSQSLQLKVTLDDKKVSQFMTRAARLNEAFSVVRRVPVVRPSLPAGGVTPWPVMSLR